MSLKDQPQHDTASLPESNLDPLVCPLCGQANSCLNQGSADIGRSCWCNDPDIYFPESLLSQIPPEKRRKACVCQRCAEKHQQTPVKS